jgi:indolepyruvate ferredoxin oxidoreductase beta subunit
MVQYNILLAGVGGQGLMLLSAVIGEACTHNNIEVVTEEQHGLAQRSGSISAHIRIGKAFSPLIPFGAADMIISMEAMEALRYIEFLKPNGAIIMNTRLQHPVEETNFLVRNKNENPQYIKLPEILETLQIVTSNIVSIDAHQLAVKAGNPRTENIVLLGVASSQPNFPIKYNQLKDAIERIVPKRTIEANQRSFDLGRQANI